MKKLLAIVLSLLMVMSLAVPAMADDTYSITVTNPEGSNVSINGKTFSAYKIFDATYSDDAVSYTIDKDSAWENAVDAYVTSKGEDCWFELVPMSGDDSKLLVKANADASESDARDFANFLVRNIPTGVTPVTKAASAESVVINPTEPGYYMVTGAGTAEEDQEVVAAAALYTAAPAADITLKAEAPTIDKKIVEGEDRVVANDGKVGDTVTYEITSNVPDMRGYDNYAFIVTDTLSEGLDFNNDITVTIDDLKKTAGTDYTVKTEDKTTITIVFKNFIQYLYKKDAPIVITYTADINKDAVIGNEGNPNDVKLTYSRNPNVDGDGDWEDDNPNTPIGETPEKEVKTYVTGIRITKKDGATKDVLAGATFHISGNSIQKVIVKEEVFVEDNENGTYWKLTDDTYTTDDPSTEDMDQTKYASIEIKYRRDVETKIKDFEFDVTLDVTSDSTGLVSFEGLDEGTYTITEIETVDGYNLLEDPIVIEIKSNIDKDELECNWEVVSAKEGTKDLTTTAVDGVIEFDVLNNKGQKLPETGGIGTTIFYVVGGLMMAVAVVLLVTKKKVSGK